MSLISGTTLGHYEILDLLGKGGMGEVWRARDTRLKREVAIKVLPSEVASDAARLARFEQEAQAVARLNHAHIVTIHSVEEQNGIRFLTMELVEAESLDRQIPAHGLPLEAVFKIGIAVADALAAAHAKHIVHRDLKPANIMVGAGSLVKVLDFGLAKLTVEQTNELPDEETRAKPLTRENAVMGTLLYMSPEQARGTVVDHRSDLFSLGIVLYELVTGRRPFQGATHSDLISAILRDTPPAVTELRPELPSDLGRIIARCLEKDPDRRVQSAEDVRNELESLRDGMRRGSLASFVATEAHAEGPSMPGRWFLRAGALGTLGVLLLGATFLLWTRREAAPAPVSDTRTRSSPAAKATIEPRSIAVLPFVNMTREKDQEYFSDGISEELLNLLTKVPQLRVSARTSSFSFKGKDVPIPEIARQLGVSHVLEGSVRKSGNRVRITTQLIQAADGFHLWSKTWDRDFGDVFAIQDEIAAEVVRELKLTLLGETPKARATDEKAYLLYLKALELSRRSQVARSDSLYREVLEIDPRYAPAWVGLARNMINRGVFRQLPFEEAAARATEAADKAIQLDPDCAPAHALLGFIQRRSDLSAAARHLERALAIDPNDVSVLSSTAAILSSLARLDEALAIREILAARDPLNPSFLNNLAIAQTRLRRYDDVVATLRRALSLSPDRPLAHAMLAWALLQQGDPSAALAEVDQEQTESVRLGLRSVILDALGRRSEADAALAAVIDRHGHEDAVSIAMIYSSRRDADRAFAWLERAREQADPSLSNIVMNDEQFTTLHSDPRWLPFLRKVGRAPEQLAAISFNVPPNVTASRQ